MKVNRFLCCLAFLCFFYMCLIPCLVARDSALLSFYQLKSKDITSYLPVGYVKDGSVDYTLQLQRALDENSSVLMPNFPILVNHKGLRVKSNQELTFQSQSKLVLAPNGEPRYAIIHIWGVENVIIRDAKLFGDRDKHQGNKGEWGMGINIVASKNIQVINPNIQNCWGDGIYIGQSKGRPSYEVVIKGGRIDRSRRNGISITCASDILIDGITISNTKGTNPRQGICVEPNNPADVIEKIALNNIITNSNEGGGIGIILPSLLSKDSKSVSVKIDKHIDNGSQFGVAIQGFKGKPGDRGLLGSIEITNSSWNNNKEALFVKSDFYNSYAPKLKISNSKSLESGKLVKRTFREH